MKEAGMELDIRQIKEIIPHRFPFLMIDRVTELEPNEKLVAIKNVSINEQYFVGHFPHQKVMPGVLITEAMAQAGCIYFYYSKNMHGKKFTYYLAKVTAKFMHPVIPGDQLRLDVTTIRMLSTGGFILAKAFVSDKQVAESEIGFGIRENV